MSTPSDAPPAETVEVETLNEAQPKIFRGCCGPDLTSAIAPGASATTFTSCLGRCGDTTTNNDEPDVESSNEESNVADQMNQFRQERERKKATPQRRVLRFGVAVMFVGMIMMAVTRAVVSGNTETPTQVIGIMICIIGALLISTVDLDIDMELTRETLVARIGYGAVFISLGFASGAWMVVDGPTWGLGLLVPPPAIFAFFFMPVINKDVVGERGSRNGPAHGGSCKSLMHLRPTKFITSWLVLMFSIANGSRMIYYTVHLHDEGHVEYKSEFVRILNLVVGCVIICVGSPSMIYVFYTARQTKSYTMATYSVAYTGMFLFGMQYLTEALTRDLDGKNIHWQTNKPTPSSPLWGRIAMSVLCLLLPPLLYNFREICFGLMAKLFEAKQRIKDGAFLAALIADTDPKELMERGKQRLRRVRISALNLDVMKSNSSDNATVQNLSEPCDVGEIDFFISHSWSDDPQEKCDALQEVEAKFRQVHGREPYVWLDKLCIDQTKIADDLACLPVFVMAAHKLLILSGATYPYRLWCAWEMYVFFAMAPDTTKLELVPLGSNVDTLERLKTFKAAEAHCYSEEDEEMLRSIIGDDVPRFENEIRQAASEFNIDQTIRAMAAKKASELRGRAEAGDNV